MKYKKIIFLFSVFLPLSVLLRLVQLSFTTDYATGFYIKEFESNGKAMLLVLFALAFAPAVFALFSHRSPAHPPKPNIFISAASFAVAVSIICELCFETLPLTITVWQVALLRISGVASALFFILFGLKTFINLPLPNICTAIPTVYIIFRIICDFTAISALALISENLILMFAYCTVLLFFLQFAKLYTGQDSEYNFRKLLSSGLAAIILCALQSVPHFVLKTLTGYSFMHTSPTAAISLFVMGVFIATFLFSHFSFFNSCLTDEEQNRRQNILLEKITNLCKKFK